MQVLQAACSKQLTKQQKLDIFKEEGIHLDDKIEGKVDFMCTAGKEIAIKHEQIGEARGKANGEARGRAEMLVSNIDTLMKSSFKTLAEACTMLGTTIEAYTSAKKLLS